MTCQCGATSMARHLMNLRKPDQLAHEYEGRTWDFVALASDPDLEFRVVDLKEYLR